MDDERMRRRLEAADGPARPSHAFREDLFDQLAAELDLPVDPASPGARSVDQAVSAPVTRRDPRGVGSGWWVAAAALVAVALLSTVLGAGAFVQWLEAPAPVPTNGVAGVDGVLRIAVRPDSPQVGASGTAFGGFDVDVANELGRRLARQVVLVIVSPEEMLADPAAWDVALPSTARWQAGGVGPTLDASTPYYWWPSYLVAREGQVVRLEALAGAAICVVRGSAGEAWATGGAPGPGSRVLATPSGLRPVVRADDRACLADLRAGAVTAMVTSTLTTADVTTSAGVSLALDRPVVLEARPAFVHTGAGSGRLAEAIDAALAAMQADGTLAGMATRRFGGEDLARPPSP